MGNLTREIPYRVVEIDLGTARNGWPGGDPANGAGADARRIQVKENSFEILYAPSAFYIHLGSPQAPGILVPKGTIGVPEVCDGSAFEAIYVTNEGGAGEARILTGPVRAGFSGAASDVPELSGADLLGLWRPAENSGNFEVFNVATGGGHAIAFPNVESGRLPAADPDFPNWHGWRFHVPGADPGGSEYQAYLENTNLPAPWLSMFAATGPAVPGGLVYRFQDVIARDSAAGGAHWSLIGWGNMSTSGVPEGLGFGIEGNWLRAYVRSDRSGGGYSTGGEVASVALTDDDGNYIPAYGTPHIITLDLGVDAAGRRFVRWYVDGIKRHEWLGARLANQPTNQWRLGYYGTGGGGWDDHYLYAGLGGGPALWRFAGEVG